MAGGSNPPDRFPGLPGRASVCCSGVSVRESRPKKQPRKARAFVASDGQSANGGGRLFQIEGFHEHIRAARDVLEQHLRCPVGDVRAGLTAAAAAHHFVADHVFDGRYCSPMAGALHLPSTSRPCVPNRLRMEFLLRNPAARTQGRNAEAPPRAGLRRSGLLKGPNVCNTRGEHTFPARCVFAVPFSPRDRADAHVG